MVARTPIVSGQFYPDSEPKCRAEIEGYLSVARPPADLPTGGLIGGIVPHAGWMCSGAVAAEVMAALFGGRANIETVVIFGAAHRHLSGKAALFSRGEWASPLGNVEIDEPFAQSLLAACSHIEANPDAHRLEHSIEVQVPFVKHICPGARLLPIIVPARAPATAIGQAVAKCVMLLNRHVIFLGSTDLTHYGPRYGFAPKGAGAEGLEWAKAKNDRRLIELICGMQADQVVSEAQKHQNACGPGAVAATIAACRELGATRGILLRHTTSAEVLQDRYGRMDDAVGYAGILFAR